MRTKSCRKLMNPGPTCTYAAAIQMTAERGFLEIYLDGSLLDESDIEEIASADGFEDASHMFGWFSETHGLPFEGVLIK